MSTVLRHVSAEWRPRATLVALPLLLIAGAFVFAKTARDALFVQGDGLYDLPTAYIGMAVLSGPLAWLVLYLIKVFGPRRVRTFLPVTTALALVWLSGIVHPGGGIFMTGFFMFVPLIWGVMFSVSWLLASELLDTADPHATARSFALIGAGAITGGVVAGLMARALAPYVEPHVFLWVAAGTLLAGAAITQAAQRRYPACPAQVRETAPRRVSLGIFLSNRYAVVLLAVGMAAGVVGVLVEFQFYLAAAVTGGSEREQAGLFATFYLTLNLTALGIQLWIMPHVQRRLGVGGSLLVLPLVLVGGAVGLAASASLVVASTLRVTEGGLKSSLYRANWEQAYLPLARAERTVSKVLIDGMGVRVAEGATALVLLSWLRYVVRDGELAEQNPLWIPGLLLLASAVWVLTTRRLRRELRQRPDSRFDISPGPPAGSCPVTAALGQEARPEL